MPTLPKIPETNSNPKDTILNSSWWRQLYDCIRYGMDLGGDGKTILVQGRTISLLKRSGGGVVAGSSDSFTLFEVVKADGLDTYVQINGYNPTAGRYTNNYVVFGLSRVELADGVQVSVTSTGVIYLEITYPVGGSLTVSAKFAAALPQQDNTHIYWYLATVLWADGKISSIQQPPTGIINIPCRAG